MAFFSVLQAATMIRFPAPFTLCSVTSLIGAVLTGIFQVATTGRLSPGTPQVSLEMIISVVLVVLQNAAKVKLLKQTVTMLPEMTGY